MTSPVYFNTAARLIEYAMRDAGLLARNQRPKSSDYAEYLNRLNDLVNAWQVEGIKLFLWEDISITPIASTAVYTIGLTGGTVMDKPLRVITGYFVDANDVSRPLDPISWTDWVGLGNKTETGATCKFFADKQATLLRLTVWPVPDTSTATGTFHFILQKQVPNFVSITDTSAFPLEWAMALRWGLADEICTGQPQSIVSRCAQKAAAYKSKLEDWDTEDVSIRFTPNPISAGWRSFD